MSDLSSSSAKRDDLDVESSEPDPSRPSSFKGNSIVVKLEYPRINNQGKMNVLNLKVKLDILSHLLNLEGKDEGWHDYEGDISSNNENSLTSLKARRISGRAKGQ